MVEQTDELKEVMRYMKETINRDFPAKEYKVYQLICSIFDNKSCMAYKTIDGLLMSSAMTALKKTFVAMLTSSVPVATPPNSTAELGMSKDMEELFKMAESEMKILSDESMSTMHILLALTNPSNKSLLFHDVFEKLKSVGLTYQAVKRKAGGKMTGEVLMPIKERIIDSSLREFAYLRQFATIVQPSDAERKLVGRGDIVNLVLTSMSRMDRRNVVIVGDSGVGKSALVDEVARLINEGKCPEALSKKKVVSLSISSVLAGTTLRGMVEERMNGIMAELSSSSNFILHIDGIEQMLNSGSNEGDMTTLLEQLVSSKGVSVIATTNRKSYHSKFEPAKKVASSFTRIELEELPLEDVETIVSEAAETYEKFHNVKYDKDVIKSIPSLAKRYIHSTKLPMSAIDLIDILGASKGFCEKRSPELKRIDEEIEEETKKKNKLFKEGNFSSSEAVSEKINALKAERCAEAKKSGSVVKTPVTMDDLRDTLSRITGILSIDTTGGSMSSMNGMEDNIKSRVIGQDDAVDKVCRAIRRNKVGLKRANKTIGSFLMIGSTGCGKTLLAKNIASQVFGSEKSMVRIDMSEYSEESSVGKLIGSAPGYVGYDQGGQLTEFVKHRPYCVLLLDEIEKANQKVINVFLQVLDEGRLTDNSGEVVDFTNVLILMTSNVGAKKAAEFKKSIGFSSVDKSGEIADKELNKFFPPEFINRMDDIIRFNKLTDSDLRRIVEIELDNLKGRVAELGYEAEIYETVVDDIMDSVKGKESMGARPIVRAIQDMVETRITDAIVDGVEGKTIKIEKI